MNDKTRQEAKTYFEAEKAAVAKRNAQQKAAREQMVSTKAKKQIEKTQDAAKLKLKVAERKCKAATKAVSSAELELTLRKAELNSLRAEVQDATIEARLAGVAL